MQKKTQLNKPIFNIKITILFLNIRKKILNNFIKNNSVIYLMHNVFFI